MAYRTKRQTAKGQSGSSSRRLIWAVGVALVLAIGVSSLFATGFLTGSGKKITSSELAPDITLATLGGNFQLSEHRGEVMLLYFSFPG